MRFLPVQSGYGRTVRRVAVALLGGIVALAGCGADQSTLRPESDAARSVATMWWVLLVGSTVVVSIVTLLVLLTLLKRRGRLDRVDRSDSPGATTAVLVSGAVVPAIALVALFVYVLASLGATAQPRGGTAFRIEVVGKQWFWAVRYPEQRITTANEIHVPVGVPVEVVARTGDVIHSFWVPRLNRKIDMIPGQTSSIVIDARKPGVYRGQCAEFCGVQHGNMAFLVIADPPATFTSWLNREAEPGRANRLFASAGCGGCHSITGNRVDSRFGPDLTHFGSRRTIGAGTLPNTRDDLAAWLRDPQAIKPGNKMPNLRLGDGEIRSLVDYLETHK
jgi:cytochrome c oxidase subunit II